VKDLGDLWREAEGLEDYVREAAREAAPGSRGHDLLAEAADHLTAAAVALGAAWEEALPVRAADRVAGPQAAREGIAAPGIPARQGRLWRDWRRAARKRRARIAQATHVTEARDPVRDTQHDADRRR